ncbi:hypothetical protein [Paraflavitalea pollutisoli]|uniref:hypothetical protein n=1 Tax=Paraflavitalea pollutisoli TaxID=3034143 RepID=UPI0023EDC6E1|nr:hypothetical protein [Paraflavitalea sp. H1-2-19X]
MATDGVKIIDGDTAHDIYWGIMDMYDNDEPLESIRYTFPFPGDDHFDAFHYEVYVTAYAFALWEIGGVTDDVVAEVQAVIKAGACVAEWTAHYGEEAGKARQAELDNLWTQITQPNPAIRPRKRYELVTNLHFQPDDLLVFQLPGKSSYAATVLLEVHQYRGECSYRFGIISLAGEAKPDMKTIYEGGLVGRKIPFGLGGDLQHFMAMGMEEIMRQGGIQAIMQREAERTGSFKIGVSMVAVSHNDLASFKHELQKIGTLRLKEEYRSIGSMGVGSSLEDFSAHFAGESALVQAQDNTLFRISDAVVQGGKGGRGHLTVC